MYDKAVNNFILYLFQYTTQKCVTDLFQETFFCQHISVVNNKIKKMLMMLLIIV